MNIALDISPLTSKHGLKHRIRGTGFYTRHLQDALLRYYPENAYRFFTRGEPISNNIDIVHYPYFEPFFLTLPFIKKHKTVITVQNENLSHIYRRLRRSNC